MAEWPNVDRENNIKWPTFDMETKKQTGVSGEAKKEIQRQSHCQKYTEYSPTASFAMLACCSEL